MISLLPFPPGLKGELESPCLAQAMLNRQVVGVALQWGPGCGHWLVTMCSGVMLGCSAGVLGVQRVGDSASLPSWLHHITWHSYLHIQLVLGDVRLSWWTLWSSSLNTRSLPPPGGLLRGQECGHAGLGAEWRRGAALLSLRRQSCSCRAWPCTVP